MTAFLTGSVVYGTPNEDSDVDLVILTTPDVISVLRTISDSTKTTASGARQLRFGDLNIVACTDRDDFAMWRVGTKIKEM